MSREKDIPEALLDVAEAVARAALTTMRRTADVQMRFLSSIRAMAEGALERINQGDKS